MFISRNKGMGKIIRHHPYYMRIALKSQAAETPCSDLKSWREIPGPTTLPIIGQLHNFFPGGSLYKIEGYEMWKRLYDTYGPIVRLQTVLKPPMIVICDPRFIAEIFHGENWNPLRPAFFTLKYFRQEYNRPSGESPRPAGLAIDQGEEWKNMRMKVNPIMMMPNIVKLYENAIEEVAGDMIDRVKTIRDNNNMIRQTFNTEMSKWSLESIGVIAVGMRLNCIHPKLKPDTEAMVLIQRTHDLFEVTDKLELKPSVWKYYATPTFRKAMEVYTDLEKSTAHYINLAIKDLKAKGPREENEKSVLEKLLEIDETVAHVMATDMLIAGVDTTSNAVIALLYLLATNPDKQAKLREEISTIGKGPYLKACLKESLRLMPPVGLNFRVTTNEYNILGYKIPKNMGVLLCHHVICLLNEHYPRAKEFIPERWLIEESHPLNYKKVHPFAHQPFGFGVRSCIGRRIAVLEIETMVAHFVKSFNISWVGPPPQVVFSNVNYVKGPYNFIFDDLKK